MKYFLYKQCCDPTVFSPQRRGLLLVRVVKDLLHIRAARLSVGSVPCVRITVGFRLGGRAVQVNNWGKEKKMQEHANV